MNAIKKVPSFVYHFKFVLHTKLPTINVSLCSILVVDKILCLDDLANMKKEMKYLADLERKLTSEKMSKNIVFTLGIILH